MKCVLVLKSGENETLDVLYFYFCNNILKIRTADGNELEYNIDDISVFSLKSD